MEFKSVSLLLLLFIVNLLSSIVASSEDKEKSLSTSISGMVQLLATESNLISSVDKYADELQKKVDTLKNLVKELKEENEKSFKSPEEYLYNPLNGFALIRRMHNDWPKIELFMIEPVGEAELQVIRKHRPDMPTTTDLAEASEGLNRMQTVYDLKATDMVDGILNGKQYDAKMKSIDAYFMGYYLYTKKEYYAAGFCFYSALMIFEENEFNRIVDYGKERPLELYAETLMHLDHPRDAFEIMKRAVEIKPQDVRLVNRLNEIHQRANTFNGEPVKYPTPLLTSYEQACRGFFANRTSQLYCLYNSTTTAFLRLAPLKMEIVQLNPYMVLLHDVMSDSEIEHLKKLARPSLRRAKVFSVDGSNFRVAPYRTSKISWFQDDTDEITKRINTRIVDMTGFDIRGSEMLQVMNYGMGGHYNTHYDFFDVSDSQDKPMMKDGDRIATVLFYLSDVEQGGATVFPNINTAVFPQKGSAVMWYNLNNELKGDYLTLHAACPVIVGSKWVCTKWIRSKAQMFRRPCYK